MKGPTSAGWRSVRGGAISVLAVVLAAAGHSFAGGALPDLTVVLPAAGMLGVICSGMARRRLSFPRLLAVLLSAQVGLHLIFELAAHADMAPVSGPSLPVMASFHAGAAILTALVLAGAERALFAASAPARALRLLLSSAPAADRPLWTVLVPDSVAGPPALPARSPWTAAGHLLRRS